MYTNINLEEFYDIINNEYYVNDILNTFFIDKHDLLILLSRMMEHYSYIKYNNFNRVTSYYKQSKGIPMGGSLSYHISEVVTARHIEKLKKLSISKLKNINPIVSIYKYVDDILVICNNTFFEDMELINHCLNNMAYELIREDENKKITFLNLQLQRHNNIIEHTWYCKPYTSFRTIDFFSSQPWLTKYSITL